MELSVPRRLPTRKFYPGKFVDPGVHHRILNNSDQVARRWYPQKELILVLL